jgi:Mg/Co/Ni transporter MgtE
LGKAIDKIIRKLVKGNQPYIEKTKGSVSVDNKLEINKKYQQNKVIQHVRPTTKEL